MDGESSCVLQRRPGPGASGGQPDRHATMAGMEITVLLFASIAEAAGTRRLVLAHRAGDTVKSVRERLLDTHPQLARFVPTLLYAINEEYARENEQVPAGATLALIPPVSGG